VISVGNDRDETIEKARALQEELYAILPHKPLAEDIGYRDAGGDYQLHIADYTFMTEPQNSRDFYKVIIEKYEPYFTAAAGGVVVGWHGSFRPPSGMDSSDLAAQAKISEMYQAIYGLEMQGIKQPSEYYRYWWEQPIRLHHEFIVEKSKILGQD